MAYTKDFHSHIGKELSLASSIVAADYNAGNGVIQYTDSIVASAATGWDLTCAAYIAAIASADATIELYYSESIDDSTYQAPVLVGTFTYAKAAGTVKKLFTASVNPENFLSTTTHVKFGCKITMSDQIGETGTAVLGMTATGLGVRDISLAAWDDYKSTLVD